MIHLQVILCFALNKKKSTNLLNMSGLWNGRELAFLAKNCNC